LERYDFTGAAETFAALAHRQPCENLARIQLARCLNELGRSAEAAALLEGLEPEGEAAAGLRYQRAFALLAVGQAAAAEAELRAVLAATPRHALACRLLMKLLREAGRRQEMLAACEALAAQGVRHSQLLLDWGRALAANGQLRQARALMFDPARIGRLELPAPPTFAETSDFRAALADALAGHHLAMSSFGMRDANCGSRRVEHLLGGGCAELARAFTATLQAAIDRFMGDLQPVYDPDPWLAARPRRARLSAWGLIQRSGEFEDWHSHPNGWLSGVCYLRLPRQFAAEGDGAGCIEFGPPSGLAGLSPCAPQRIAPREGLLLLAPSHYMHRTIPFAGAGERISFAFDVVPDDA
jgi:tetratricopeptide (TPR) repeat protein